MNTLRLMRRLYEFCASCDEVQVPVGVLLCPECDERADTEADLRYERRQDWSGDE